MVKIQTYIFSLLFICYPFFSASGKTNNEYSSNLLASCIRNTVDTKFFKIKRLYHGDRKGKFIEKWMLPDRYHSKGWVQYDDKKRILIEDTQIKNILYRKINKQSKWSKISHSKFENPLDFLLGFNKIELGGIDYLSNKECIILKLTEPSKKKEIISWHRDKANVWIDKDSNLILQIEVEGFLDGSTKEVIKFYDFKKTFEITIPERS